MPAISPRYTPRVNTTARGSAWEVARAFLTLGVTSFGGPVAHLGFFRTEFVDRRRWLDDRAYADLVALCQFLPGPASSQVGFAIGLLRAGPLGALAAFLAFTLPSAVLMVAFAFGAALFEGPVGAGILEGLKIVAVAIVAQAVWGMARTLAPDPTRAAIAAGAAGIALLAASASGQLIAIALGAVVGLLLCRPRSASAPAALRVPVSRAAGIASLAAFVALLIALPLVAVATSAPAAALADAFYRAGALVFGGGHVVLPLLEAEVVATGWVTAPEFLAGYGAAQAMPGPLFTFAAFLGAASGNGAGGLLGAVIALVAIFLPGFLLLIAALPFWGALRASTNGQGLMNGANAAVVGILAAALYDPVFTTAITGAGSFTVALGCFVLLVAWKLPPWAVVLVGAAAGVVLELAGI